MSSMGGGVVARLRTIMGLDTKEFEAGIKNAKGGAKDFQKGLSEIASTLGVAFSFAAVVAFGKSFMDWAGKISDAAGNVGILTSEMASLNAVFAKQGLGTDELQKMFAKLEGDVFAAATGSKKLDDIYGKLGFTIQDLVKLEPAELFREATKRALESASPTAALAELYGAKIGPKARLALEEVVKGYDRVSEAQGRVMDEIDNAGDRWAGWMNSFKQSVVTPVIGFYQEWIELASDAWAAALTTGSGKKWYDVGDKVDRFRGMGSDRQAQAAKLAAEQKARSEKERQELQKLADETAAREAKEKSQKEQTQRDEKTFEDWWKRNQKEKADWAAKQVKNAQDRLAIERQIAEQGNRHAERLVSIQESAQGRGVNPDSMARMGGFAGGERAGLAALDRQINVQIETARAVRENSQAIKELTAQLPSITGSKTGVPD